MHLIQEKIILKQGKKGISREANSTENLNYKKFRNFLWTFLKIPINFGKIAMTREIMSENLVCLVSKCFETRKKK